MRLSLAQGTVGVLTAVVAAGLLAMPSRVLGPDGRHLTPIVLPRPGSSPVVVAAAPPPAAHARSAPARPVVARRAPSAQLASVVVPVGEPHAAPVHRIARRAAPAVTQTRHLPVPTDEARPAPAPAPAPAPVPPPTTPPPAPTTTVAFVAYHPHPDAPSGPPTTRTGQPLMSYADFAASLGLDMSHSGSHVLPAPAAPSDGAAQDDHAQDDQGQDGSSGNGDGH
jgi:hypothetical protein